MPMNATSIAIPEGDPGTIATIEQMRRLIDHGMKDPYIHELAAGIIGLAGVRAFDWMGEARAVYNWVRQHIRFTRDVRGKETLHAANDIVRLGIGDCDDFTILICSLMGTIGAKCSIITVASDPRDPDLFSHVYPEVSINGRWVTMDAARRDPRFGLAPANYYRKRRWDAVSPEFQDLEGLGSASAPTPAPHMLQFRKRNPYGGLGRVRRRGMHGLGQPSTLTPTAAQLPQDITAATVGISDIISASRASPYNLTATTSTPIYNSAGQVVGYSAASANPFTTFFSETFMGLPLWLLLGAGIAAVVVMENR